MCNSKIIGARYFNKGMKANIDPSKDSARDDGGHGTQVASIAAGRTQSIKRTSMFLKSPILMYIFYSTIDVVHALSLQVTMLMKCLTLIMLKEQPLELHHMQGWQFTKSRGMRQLIHLIPLPV
jgi:subtilisin family serine protease